MHSDSQLTLDPTTLLFSISLLGFVTAGFAFSSSRVVGAKREGLVEWSRAMAGVGVAFLLYFFRGHAPAFLTYLVANAVVLAVPAQGLLAHASFFGAPPPKTTITLLCAFGFIGVAAVFFFQAPLGAGVFTMSVAIAVMLGMTGAHIVRNEGWKFATSSGFTASTMFLLAAVSATRAAYCVVGAGNSVSMVNNTRPNVVTLACGTLFVVAASTGFVMMVHDRRRRDELESSRRDALTGLLTRAAFFDAASGVQARGSEPYAMVVIDVDHFKSVNDTHGHAGGDIVLSHLGKLIQSSIRTLDIAGRFGGDELCVILPGCGMSQARRFAERLILDTGQRAVPLPGGASVNFTISAGYSVRQPAADVRALESAQRVFERADAALYEAKRLSRNRAVLASEATPTALDV